MNVQRQRLIADGFATGLIGYVLTGSHRSLAGSIEGAQETRLGRIE